MEGMAMVVMSSGTFRRAMLLAGLAYSFMAAAPGALAAETDHTPLPVALVDALNQLSHGPHPGFRANHAKGIMLLGSFTPAASAAGLTNAAHFKARVPVMVRFSDATGVPTLPDADPAASPHGMAIRFTMPDGTFTDIVAISADSFPVSTPQDFLALLKAIGATAPNAPKPTPIETFLGKHPAALKFVRTPRPPPVSFATLAYHGVNAFKFTNAAGSSHYVRYEIQPVAGEHALSDTDLALAAPDYLMNELPKRVAQSAVQFRLLAQVAAAGDAVDDPTVVWPAIRPHVLLGTLRLNKVIEDQMSAQKLIMFNPLNLLPGIEPSDDPVLLARPAAYGVSFGQRVQ